MESKIINNKLYVFLVGNIDSSNADRIGSEIESLRRENNLTLVFDCKELKYISSAGLRQILKFKKIDNDLSIINVSSEIYDIFEMTGFTEMMSISKGYRQFSVDGCEILGRGSNGDVYRIDNETIIKVYKDKNALDSIKRERELAKKAFVLGVNTAIPFDVVEVGDTYGSIFELINSKTLTKHISSDINNIEKYVNLFVEMLKTVHSVEILDNSLPKYKNTVIDWTLFLKNYLPNNSYIKLLSLIEEIKDSNYMLHGDYHTNNVHYDGKETILIDMDTLSVGNPIFEFGSIYLAYVGYGVLNKRVVEDYMNLDYEVCNKIYALTLEKYFNNKAKEEIELIKKKAELIGLIRMLRRTIRRDKENIALIEYSKKRLIELVDIIDDLSL